MYPLPHPNPYSQQPQPQQQQQQQHQLPSMPPIVAQYGQDNMQMPAPGPLPHQGQPGDGALQSPAQATPQERPPLTAEQKRQQLANLSPFSSTDSEGRTYTLDVVQQPQRARMCGFGDKDRRPITPPPCVRLIITDSKTGKEIDCNQIEHTMYVLNVDLWSEDALKEVNLVRHTTATPSISSTTPASYASLDQSTPAFSNILPSSRDVGYPQQMGYPSQGPPVNYMAQGMQQGQYGGGFVGPNGGGYVQTNQFYPQDYRNEIHGIPQLASQSPSAYGPPRVFDPQFNMSQRLSIGGNQPQGMFTRNLIGSLAASAFRLTDTDDKIGIWFILQDLSVRTEGSFRLRFSFVNVGLPSSNGNSSASVNQGKAPVLASVFSDVFQVYSAKKFPGVCESTALSKCFATQGIKIPIRKEGANNKGNQDDDDYE
ncbi:velvet factor-domain-containing protein [Podospora didyma]|uniref:Velvet factor-domain-containing protein n=1 Tax=Podospora didyma TaxID=330526 RepID=A0AAE0U877_9PEZI|nr:velvet factor-domain-containing protein [Podospora didyma]